jgi:hypothetical protein
MNKYRVYLQFYLCFFYTSWKKLLSQEKFIKKAIYNSGLGANVLAHFYKMN